MAKEIGENKRKPARNGGGKFFFGTLFGFFLCIALLAGLGAFIYFKVSVKWVNKTFRTNVTLGSDELDSLTLKTATGHAINLMKNVDTYTLNDLKTDFGIVIGDEVSGFDISDLKSVALTKLPDAVQDKISNISAEEIKGVLDIDSDPDDTMYKIFNKEQTLYLTISGNNVRFFYDEEKTSSNEMKDVPYTYDSTNQKITFKKKTVSIADGKVNVKLRYLPLTKAIDAYAKTLGSTTTLGDLENDYGVTLPSYFKNVSRSTSINGLSDAINDLYLADFLEYEYNTAGDFYYIEKGTNTVYNVGVDKKVEGIMNTFARKKVGQLGSIDDEFRNITADEMSSVMDIDSMNNIFGKGWTYYYSANKLYKESTHTNEVEFEYTINGSNVQVKDKLFPINASDEVVIALKYIPMTTAVSTFTSNLGDTLTLKELKDDYGFNLTGFLEKIDEDTKLNEIETAVKDLYVSDFMGDGTLTGMMAKLGTLKISDLEDQSAVQTVIDTMTIAEVMEYHQDGSVWKDKNNNTITGIMAAIAGTNIADLSDRIDTLKVAEVIEVDAGSPLSLIDAENTNITEIGSAFQVAFMGDGTPGSAKTLFDMQAVGLIDSTADLTKDLTAYGYAGKQVGDLTLAEIVALVSNLP